MNSPPPRPLDFEGMLQPLSRAQFFAEYWEKKPYYLQRQSPGYYGELLTRTDLENTISDSDLRYPAIRLARDGGYFAPEAYTRDVRYGDESFEGVPDVQQILAEYRAGATVALPAMHRTWPALRSLCGKLQSQLDHPAHANVYITPADARGFTPHYDVHEVFVLQIAGRKRWFIYAPVVTLPHRTQSFTPQLFSGQAPIAQIDLEAGDLLYLPRGYLHSTATSDSYSAHVTIGITVYTLVDLLREYLQSAIADERMRVALPPGFASRGDLRPLLREKMTLAMDTLRADAAVGSLLDAFTARVRAAHVPRPERFDMDVTAIDARSTFRTPPPGSYKIVEAENKTWLEFNGKRYPVPMAVSGALRAMSARTTFRAAELAGELDPAASLSLCRHLLEAGFLTLQR